MKNYMYIHRKQWNIPFANMAWRQKNVYNMQWRHNYTVEEKTG